MRVSECRLLKCRSTTQQTLCRRRGARVPLDESFGVDIPERVAFDRRGNVIGTLPLPQCLTTWGRLYELLRGAFPEERYHFGHSLARVKQSADNVVAMFANGASAEGDLLVGADGIRSTARGQLLPQARPADAGYVAWRGERCYNFVWYRPASEAQGLPDICTDIHGHRHDMSVPPPLIRPEVASAVRRAAEDLLSPQFAAVVRNTA